MKEVFIYSKENCPFCDNAKELLATKGVSYVEYKVDADSSRLQEMLTKSNGARSVPQIFIGDYHVGGFDDLQKLQNDQKLDEILSNEG